MAATLHGFCTLHRIAYNRSLDPTCPQCMLSHQNVQQLDFDANRTTMIAVPSGAPLDDAGKPLHPATLEPIA